MERDIRIPMNATGRTDIHNNPVRAILDPEIRRQRADQLERRRVVDGQHRLPLFVGHLSPPLASATHPNP